MNNRVFRIQEDDLVLKGTNEPVPENEPAFVLRARSKKALGTLRVHQSLFAPTSDHWKVIQAVIDDFTKFREENPDLMGEPSEVY